MPRILTVLLGAILVTAALLTPASPASAGVLDATCTPPSSNTVTYNPPLTLTPSNVQITGSTSYGPCVSLSVPGLTSGSTAAQATGTRSCLSLLGASPRTFTITWNTGQTSTLSGNQSSTIVGAALVVAFTGTVTSGLFTGDTVLHTITGPATDVTLCTLGLGTVSSIYSTVTLEITSV
jgi:hypothetical protein